MNCRVRHLLFAISFAPLPLLAQHEEHSPPPSHDEKVSSETNPDPMEGMEGMDSGDRWTTMFHGYAFLTANRQGGPSGDRQFASQNHVMASALRPAWGGRLSLSGIFTLEPATIPPAGGAELFQRGETYHGALLVDRQHPHDLFVELAAAWEKQWPPGLGLRVYLAPVGEPALGPVAYPHRLSASENPNAPLSHHNQDSTHIAYDVATVGLTASILTIEGSAFHGAEPDENRWNLEAGALDSYSGRLTIRPLSRIAVQVSSGRLKHPEATEDGNQTRSTLSIAYEATTSDGFLAVTAAAGRNRTPDGPEWGSLLEWTWKFAGANFVFGRLESVDRDLYELNQKRQRPADVPHVRTRVDAATLGFVRDLRLVSEAETGVGAAVTGYRFTDRLRSVYGSHPLSVQGFLRIRFGTHGASHAGHSVASWAR
jgi:hypothetical protein